MPKSLRRKKFLPQPRPLSLLCALLWLTGCASTAPPGTVDAPAAEAIPPAATVLAAADSDLTPADTADTTETTETEITPDSKPAEPRYGNFSEDVLTRAILAELAGQRGHNQQALDDYVILARETGDLNIVKRAMRSATFLRNPQIALEMGDRWLEQEPDSVEAR